MIVPVLRWMRANVLQAALSACLGAAFGYLANVALMLFRYDGYEIPSGQPAVGPGNLLWGSLIWGVLSTVLFALFGYWRSVGTRRFLEDLRGLPAQFARMMEADGPAARAHLLWGASVSLLALFVIGPWLGAVVAVGLLAFLPSVLGRFVSGLALRAWMAVMQALSPKAGPRQAGPVTMAVGILGGASATLLAFFLPSGWIRLGLAVGCGAWAHALASRGGGARPALLLWLPALVLGWEALRPEAALAHDGGWWEYSPSSGRRTPWGWLQSEGAGTLLAAGLASVPSSVGGAVFGTGLGQVMGGSGWGDWYGEPPPGRDVEYTQEHSETLGDLLGEVSDPALVDRLDRLCRQAETGRIDARELEALRREQDRLNDERRRQIDEDHRRFSDDDRERRSRRDEEEAREQARLDAERQRLDDRERAARHAVSQMDDPVKQQQLEDFLDRHREDDPDARARAIDAVRDQSFGADQQRRMGEQEEAAGEADAWQGSEAYAEGVRDWSMRANRTLSKFLPGGQQVVAAQAALYGGIQGYDEGGLRGALGRTAANLADNYTEGGGTATYETLRRGGGLGDLAERWGASVRTQYDPSEYVRRVREAKSLGDLVDVGLDASDTAADLRRRIGDAPPVGDESPTPRRAGAAPEEVRPRAADGPEPTPRPERTADAPEPAPRPERTGAEPALDSASRGPRREGAEAHAAWDRHQKAENVRRDAESDAFVARDRVERARAAEEAARSRRDRDPEGYQDARDRLDRAEAARKASETALDRANQESQKTRQEFDDERTRRMDRDPRRAQARAADALDDARTERAAAADERKKAIQELTRDPRDPEAQKKLQDAADRHREAQAEVAQAEDRLRTAGQRLAGHRAAEERATRALDGMIEKTFGAPPAKGGLTIHQDRPALGSEYRRGGAQPHEVTEVTDPRSGVKVAIDPARSPQDQVDGAATRSEPLPRRRDPSGLMGFDRQGDSHSLPVAGTAAHERVHGHASDGFRAEHGRQTNLNEGITEHYTRRVRDETGLTGRPGWDRDGHYDRQADAAGRLERVVGKDTMEGAYFRGDTEAMHRRLGEAMGHTDPDRAQASGRQAMGTLEAEMQRARQAEDAARAARRLGDAQAARGHQVEANRIWRNVNNMLTDLEGRS